MAQIRLNKTPELEEVLAYLRSRYRVLSEAEIIKVALAEKYKKEMGDLPLVDEDTEKLIAQATEDVKQGKYAKLKTEQDLEVYLKSL